MAEDRIYYVYCIFDPGMKADHEILGTTYSVVPRYIGKGKNNRINDHLRVPKNIGKATDIQRQIANMRKYGYEPTLVKLRENLTEEEAFSYEVAVIAKLKRTWEGGPLVNRAPGGRYVPKWAQQGKSRSPKKRARKVAKRRRAQSDLMKEMWKDPEFAAKATVEARKPRTQVTKDRMSSGAKERWRDPEQLKHKSNNSKALWQDKDYREKIAANHTHKGGARPYVTTIVDKDGKSYTFGSVTGFVREMGKQLGITAPGLNVALRKGNPTYKEYNISRKLNN